MSGQLNGKCVLILTVPNPWKKLFSRTKTLLLTKLLHSQVPMLNQFFYDKHLGFVLDSKMNYSKHLDEKIAKASQGIGVIKRLYNYLPRKVLLQIYISYIRPNLDYCDVIYHKPSYDDFYCACYSGRAKADRVNTNAQFNSRHI